jgi:hypothetical protein
MVKIIPFERSFASNPLSQYWSNKNEILPNEVYKSSAKSYIFNCNICNHEFSMKLSSITSHDTWCSFCANKQFCDNDNCSVCFEKSFASYQNSHFWSKKNTVSPDKVFKCSNKFYLFDCNVCNHEFSMALNNIICKNRWCSFCSNQILCGDDNCSICFEKSFASIIKSQYWSSKNILLPKNVFKSSNVEYLFDCNVCGHEFSMSLYNITTLNMWCSFCANSELCGNNNCSICFTPFLI